MIDWSLWSRNPDEGEDYVKNSFSLSALRKALLSSRFGRAAKKMLDSGKLKIVQSADKLPADAVQSDVAGAYIGANDTLYLVADNLNNDTLDEAFHGRAETVLGTKQYNRLMKRLENIKRLSSNGGKVGRFFQDALDSIPANTPEGDVLTEMGAYAIERFENAPRTLPQAFNKWVQDFIAAIRVGLMRLGWMPKNVTAADLSAIARSAVRKFAESEAAPVGDSVLASMARQLGVSEEQLRKEYEAVKQRHEGTDEWLKAPNGEPSNLNEQQWVMVRTSRFKAWFGDWETALKYTQEVQTNGDERNRETISGGATEGEVARRDNGGNYDVADAGRAGILDGNGEPAIFYHGTSDDVEFFDIDHPNRKDMGWLGRGVYVIDSPNIASSYANLKGGMADPNVMPVYVAVRNPYIATLEVKNRLKNASQEYIDEVTAQLIERGYDGVMLTFDNGMREVAAFRSEQIKSVFNRGAFDQNDPRILYSRQTDNDAPEVKASGCWSATRRSAAAGPLGLRRPCSQSCMVRTLTPSKDAKSDWLNSMRLRMEEISCGAGTVKTRPHSPRLIARMPSRISMPTSRLLLIFPIPL